MSLFEHATANVYGYKDVTPRQLYEGRRNERLVDVREPHEFDAELGHVPGSELVPLAALPAAAARWPRDADLVLICRSGGRSARAARALVELSFGRVMNLAGGLLAYNEAGLPVERA
jgi:rhodanese-related sulfurtransferase